MFEITIPTVALKLALPYIGEVSSRPPAYPHATLDASSGACYLYATDGRTAIRLELTVPPMVGYEGAIIHIPASAIETLLKCRVDACTLRGEVEKYEISIPGLVLPIAAPAPIPATHVALKSYLQGVWSPAKAALGAQIYDGEYLCRVGKTAMDIRKASATPSKAKAGLIEVLWPDDAGAPVRLRRGLVNDCLREWRAVIMPCNPKA